MTPDVLTNLSPWSLELSSASSRGLRLPGASFSPTPLVNRLSFQLSTSFRPGNALLLPLFLSTRVSRVSTPARNPSQPAQQSPAGPDVGLDCPGCPLQAGCSPASLQTFLLLVPNDNHYMPLTTSLQASSLLWPSPKWVMLGPAGFLPWPCHTSPSMPPHGPLGTHPVLIKPCAPSPAFWLHPARVPALQPAGLLKDICHSLGAVQKPFRIPSGLPCKTRCQLKACLISSPTCFCSSDSLEASKAPLLFRRPHGTLTFVFCACPGL